MLFGRGHLVLFASLAALAAPAACSKGSSNEAPSPVAAGGNDDAAGQSGVGAGAGAEQPRGAGGAGGAINATGGAGSGAGGDSSSGGDVAQPAGAAGSAGTPDLGAGGSSPTCDVVVMQQELAPALHVDLCSEIQYATNPPSSGEHYETWADFGVYDFPLPRGFWVHNLEHGAVVVTYNCPGGCADEVADASAWLAQLGPDENCPAGAPRVLLVPDPELDVRWAASSWGFTLRADCFDAVAFSDFYIAHAGQPPAPEYTVCGAGADLRDPAANTCGAH